MQAVIFVTDPSEVLLKRIEDYFDDYELVQLTAINKDKYYSEAWKALNVLNENGRNVFQVVNGNAAFNALLAVKLVQEVGAFFLVEWVGDRFRVLRVP